LVNKRSSKIKTVYICSKCGYQSSKWLGKCPNCEAWNSFTEEITGPLEKKKKDQGSNKIKTLSGINIRDNQRLLSNIHEFDRLCGGGIIPGSVLLISGEPGIGKSTLLLQIANAYAAKGKVLYVSAEESEEQIKSRADRLKINSDNLFILSENNISIIDSSIVKLKPIAAIIDSIQTVHDPDLDNSSGNASQIRMCTDILSQRAKSEKVPVFIVGHITKDGSIAGPKILEHMVDVVLYMEGDRNLDFRILKSNKNRFGSTFEIAVFEMGQHGLTPVNDPSSFFIDREKEQLPGSATVTIMEGTRPIMVEIQSLVAPSTMAYPRRIAEGIDYNKVVLISAILEKILGVKLNAQEIYLKVAGGLKINEPSIDLGIAGSILSSYKNKPVEKGTILIGEIGLTGEIRAVPYIQQRLKEIEKLGFKKAFIPEASMKKISHKFSSLEIRSMKFINEIENLFSNSGKAYKNEKQTIS